MTIGFFTLFMGLLCLIYLICSLRTNLCFVAIFLGLVLGFFLLTGAVWQLANGNPNLARTLKKVSPSYPSRKTERFYDSVWKLASNMKLTSEGCWCLPGVRVIAWLVLPLGATVSNSWLSVDIANWRPQSHHTRGKCAEEDELIKWSFHGQKGSSGRSK